MMKSVNMQLAYKKWIQTIKNVHFVLFKRNRLYAHERYSRLLYFYPHLRIFLYIFNSIWWRIKEDQSLPCFCSMEKLLKVNSSHAACAQTLNEIMVMGIFLLTFSMAKNTLKRNFNKFTWNLLKINKDDTFLKDWNKRIIIFNIKNLHSL